jgi:2'-5' RNA ligase
MTIGKSGAGADPAAARLRVFYAIWPDASARRLLASAATRTAQEACGRSTKVDNLHVTLAFVGEVAAERLDALHAIGAGVAAAGQAFALALDRCGSFRRQGIAWVGPSVVPEALARLVADLGDRLAQAGFRTERGTFAPHVTLARRCTQPVAAAAAAPICWRVDAVTLTASTLTPHGPDYRPLARWPLRGPDG